jgi:hypothetical protein
MQGPRQILLFTSLLTQRKFPSQGPQTSTWELILNSLLDYQLDFVTPGILPASAISRKRTRLMPNLRM